LDESVSTKIAFALRIQQFDVTTTQEAGLRSTPDSTQFDFALLEQRVLITKDTDFLRIASEHWDHPGILYCKSDAGIGEIVLGCIALDAALNQSEMRGRIEYL
jgi:predicted nuclease of predicted toxin-antitoxin system